jgi:hypothetical protein
MFDAVQTKALVDDFTQWRGDTYRLAILVAERASESERNQIIAALEAAGMAEAANLLKA